MHQNQKSLSITIENKIFEIGFSFYNQLSLLKLRQETQINWLDDQTLKYNKQRLQDRSAFLYSNKPCWWKRQVGDPQVLNKGLFLHQHRDPWESGSPQTSLTESRWCQKSPDSAQALKRYFNGNADGLCWNNSADKICQKLVLIFKCYFDESSSHVHLNVHFCLIIYEKPEVVNDSCLS